MAAQALGWAALVVLADVPRAQAALQCEYYDQLVAEAVMVMQIAPSLIEAPAAQSEFCRVQGEVIRAFKGPHPVGTMIETSIPCQNGWVDASGETVFMVGPTVYTDRAAMEVAAVIELHIGPQGGPAGYGAGVALLAAPTDAPAWRSQCRS